MSFSAPKVKIPKASSSPPPPPPLPPASPPIYASAQQEMTGDAVRAAAASASGMGFADTLKTSPQGAPAAATGQKTLLGQ